MKRPIKRWLGVSRILVAIQGEHPMTKLQSIGFNATTSFDRSAFGVGAYVPNVGDKITVNITTEASVPAKK
jgi:polyisoprenoid-binding protein YceI